jgi:hypothetical protein
VGGFAFGENVFAEEIFDDLSFGQGHGTAFDSEYSS